MGKKVYSDEFKRGAVEQVLVQRYTMSSVARRLGVNYHTVRG
jgi:transposase-like protein